MKAIELVLDIFFIEKGHYPGFIDENIPGIGEKIGVGG